MTDRELSQAVLSTSVETGSLVCLGCGYEHDCGIHGCAILREAASRLASLQAENAELKDQIGREQDSQVCHNHTCNNNRLDLYKRCEELEAALACAGAKVVQRPDKPMDIYHDHCMFRANRLSDGEEVYGALVADGSCMSGPMGLMPPTCVYHIIQLCTINGKPHNSDDLVDPDTVGIFLGRTNEYGRAVYESFADFIRCAASKVPDDPLTLINSLRQTDPYIQLIYTNGGCWRFYKFLRMVFPTAEAYKVISKPTIRINRYDHIITKIGNQFFDITGEVRPTDFCACDPVQDDDILMFERWSFAGNNLLSMTCPHCGEDITIDSVGNVEGGSSDDEQ